MSGRTIELPSCFRNRHNTGAATIDRGRILTPSTTVEDGCALATGATVEFCGVSVEEMQGSTYGRSITRSVQVSGKALVIPGAQIAIGDKITCDSTGRAIPVTTSAQTILGKAESAAATAQTSFALETAVEVELTCNGGSQVAASGGLRCLTMRILNTDLSDADTSQDFALGTIPSGAWIVGYSVMPTALIVKGAQTFALDIGYSGSAEYVAANLSVGTGGTAGTVLEAAVSKCATADRALLCNITTNTGTLASCTAGDVTIRVFYFVPTVTDVDPTP
jgi:hypothetical protein